MTRGTPLVTERSIDAWSVNRAQHILKLGCTHTDHLHYALPVHSSLLGMPQQPTEHLTCVLQFPNMDTNGGHIIDVCDLNGDSEMNTKMMSLKQKIKKSNEGQPAIQNPMADLE
jgi:hypothetical protein